MKKIKTLFIGSGYFAVEIFKGLQEIDDVVLAGVITQPDRPAGREKQIQSSDLGKYLESLSANGSNYSKQRVFKPEKLKIEAEQILDVLKPELVIVADYGQMIPESIINFPKYKCLNVHGSILPDLRGAVPAQVAILKGYKKTGVSIVVMTAGLDDGDVVCSGEVGISPGDDARSLRFRLAQKGNELLVKNLSSWIQGELKAVPQDHTRATYTYKKDVAKEKARIFPETSAVQAGRMIRAFSPWPVAWAFVGIGKDQKRLKIFKVQNTIISLKQIEKAEQGKLMKVNKQLALVLLNGALVLEKVQIEGKNIDSGKNYLFLAGRSIE